MSLEIVTYPAKVLSRPARRIQPGEFDLQQLFADMQEAMRVYVGVGLAAPQIGQGIRFLVAEDRRTGEKRAYVNPQIIEFSNEQEIGPEGCLSFPGLVGDIPRAKRIKIRYQDLDFNTIEEEESGFYARVLQHEVDHLNGVLLIDRAIDGLYEVVEDDAESAEDAGQPGCGPLETAPDNRGE
ncbi:peptide deformylase [bacterium]|nr:peptide deformylase [bacterium]